mgnify:CR=1 FL=1
MQQKRAMVRNADAIEVFDRGGGVVTRLFCNKAICGADVTTGTTTLPVGKSVPLHYHNCDEQIVILQGRAEAEFGGKRVPPWSYGNRLYPGRRGALFSQCWG